MLLANSPETVDKLEGLVALWSKEIELVLAESEQVLGVVMPVILTKIFQFDSCWKCRKVI